MVSETSVPSRSPSHQVIWHLLLSGGLFLGMVIAPHWFVFLHRHTIEKFLPQRFGIEKCMKSQRNRVGNAILSYTDPAANIPVLIYRVRKQSESLQEPFPGREPKPPRPPRTPPQANAMIFPARNLFVQLKIFTAIVQAPPRILTLCPEHTGASRTLP